ncbi:MAG: hypothetical protein WBN03_09975 [Desulfobacterales bacterium]
METHEAVEALKALIIENNLPQTDIAIFGIKCPYCGKSDRIHRLEPPEYLPQSFSAEDTTQYGVLWHTLNPEGALLGVCKFCHNPLELQVRAGLAKVLDNGQDG